MKLLKIFGVWVVYLLVCSAIWYWLSEGDSWRHSLLIGASIGSIGAAVYAFQHRSRAAKR